jgi:hypothetical protein
MSPCKPTTITITWMIPILMRRMFNYVLMSSRTKKLNFTANNITQMIPPQMVAKITPATMKNSSSKRLRIQPSHRIMTNESELCQPPLFNTLNLTMKIFKTRVRRLKPSLRFKNKHWTTPSIYSVKVLIHLAHSTKQTTIKHHSYVVRPRLLQLSLIKTGSHLAVKTPPQKQGNQLTRVILSNTHLEMIFTPSSSNQSMLTTRNLFLAWLIRLKPKESNVMQQNRLH